MTEVLTLSTVGILSLEYSSHTLFDTFPKLISSLFERGNKESDINHPLLIVIGLITPESESELDHLIFNDKALLLRYFFSNLNVLVVDANQLLDKEIVSKLNNATKSITSLITNRISRVQTWTGTGNQNVNDIFLSYLGNDINFASSIPTMSCVLCSNINKSRNTTTHLIQLKDLIINEIDFKSILSNHTPEHLSKLCHLVGHWSFPSHELSNDDLIYCVYLMIQYALNQIEDATFHVPSSNELLGFVFMVRDSYKNGNPFHNFRHAVDVLHACFHFLIRLNCLPQFEQFEQNPAADELKYLNGESAPSKSVTLVAKQTKRTPKPQLNQLQVLGLLVAALGHDVGHPGVTNAFMVKYNSPTSVAYNERSVLELFHTSVFINKLLAVNWPSLLSVSTDAGTALLLLKDLIITSILATDMAEHFEYLNRLSILTKHQEESSKVKLLCSLLIKCADISNVTRPLRVSSQWAMVLGREFEEVSLLEQRISQEPTSSKDEIRYDHVPVDLKSILELSPNLHKGQIFFINTFAEKLFKNVAELLPDLLYACDIILDNKEFWLGRN